MLYYSPFLLFGGTLEKTASCVHLPHAQWVRAIPGREVSVPSLSEKSEGSPKPCENEKRGQAARILGFCPEHTAASSRTAS